MRKSTWGVGIAEKVKVNVIYKPGTYTGCSKKRLKHFTADQRFLRCNEFEF